MGTVAVNLKRDWFSPDGVLYLVRQNPHEFPEAWADEPTQRDDESDEDFEKREAASKYDVLPSTAEVIGEGRTVVTLQNTANGEQLLVPQVIDDDVKSVGAALDDKGNEKPSQTVAKAEAAAKELGVEAGGKPDKSGPLPHDAGKK